MAATWTAKLDWIDRATGRVRVVGVRTDGEDVRSYSIETKKPAELAAADFVRECAKALWRLHLEAVAETAASVAAIDRTDAAIAAALNTKEL